MTNVIPQIITPSSTPDCGWDGFTYIWASSITGYEIYELAIGGVSNGPNEAIKVDTSTNIWSDHGTSSPTSVVDNGTTVSLASGSSVCFVFIKPTVASWIGSGMGSLATVTWTPSFVLSGGYITATITGTPASAFGTGFVAANFKLYKSSGISNETQVSTTVEFLANTTTTSQIRTFFRDSGYIYYYRNAGTGQFLAPYINMTGGTTSTRKKVHSNFW